MKRPAISGGERRRLSVVVLGSAAADAASAPDDAALQQPVRSYGGRLVPLADGSIAVVLEANRQMASDQAARTARFALGIGALARGRPLALAMSRGGAARDLVEQDVIERAARLLAGTAGAGDDAPSIALDEVIAGLLDARFDVIEREAGFFLRGERALMPGARTLLGRPTSLVGRDWELGALTAILDECIDDRDARAAVVIGAAGMGKSRLAAELVSRVRARRDEVAIWVGRADSLRAGSTLDLLAGALRDALGIRGGEPLVDRQSRIRARVAEHVPAGDRTRVTEFLAELVDAPFPADREDGAALRAARRDARLMSEQMRRAWLDFLRAETSARPVLLVLEDLHWGDFGTVRFIDVALRELRGHPWMVLALARPELHESFPRLWAERRNFQEIVLKKLGRRASERLVTQVLGAGVPPEVMARLVTQADGNAFYLEELIRAELESEDEALPETVLAMVETRLAQLPLPARRVLHAASVFGEACWEGGVVALLGGTMSAVMVSEWLVRLVEQEVLTVQPESRFAGEPELAFRHALLREGAYAAMTDDERRLGHRLAGEWLERRGESDPLVLAGHAARGGEGARAAHHYLRAVEQAIHVLDLQAVMARASLGLACAPPEELRIALLGARCRAAIYSLQLIGAVMADAEELLRAAPPGSIPWAQAVIPYLTGTAAMGRMDDFRAVIEALRTVVPAPEALPHMQGAFIGAITLLDLLGQVAAGTALAERLAELLGPPAQRTLHARLCWNVIAGFRAAYAGDDPWSGLRSSEQIREAYEVLGGEALLLAMQLYGGLNHWLLGAHARAAQMLAEIPGVDDALGAAGSLRRLCLSWIHADRGALDEARALALQMAEQGRAQRDPLTESRGRWALAEVLRRSGDLEAAQRELGVALEMAMPLERPGVLGTLAQLRLAQGRIEEALAAAEDAIARCADMGGCGVFRGAFLRLAHAEAQHAGGAHDAARRTIAGARARLLAIAGRIPDPAYRRSFLEDVPENARTLALARAWLGEPPPDA
ncbi:MAG TPA: AAA family ATPase [Kofleriaceae bacterium]|nr:AAA family ATPase [Kofleriaceae bacterium]